MIDTENSVAASTYPPAARAARREREEREERERLERMQRAGVPPPHRDDPDGTYERYGPLAQNLEGDDAFRKDRRAWYKHVTGESLEGVSEPHQAVAACSRSRESLARIQ